MAILSAAKGEKKMDPLSQVIAARNLLENLTPLRGDCGRYCGGACCQSDEDGQGGMLLFPGEEALYAPLPPGYRLESNTAVIPEGKLLVCDGTCDRENRPLSCRLFPLLPTRKGTKMDQRAWAVCPLMEYGKKRLQEEFVEAVRQAGQMLYACPQHARFLDALHAYNERLKEF